MAALTHLRALVWNERERRLRAPIRLALGASAVGVCTALALVLLFAPLALVETLPLLGMSTGAPLAGFAAGLLASALGAVAGVWLSARFLDRRPLAGYGLGIDRDWVFDFTAGLAIGAGAMTLVFLLELAAGWITVVGAFRTPTGVGFIPAMVVVAAVFLAVGFYEELLLRGWLLTNAAEGARAYDALGPRGAVALAVSLSSIAFGGLHATNPNAGGASAATIAFAGVVLALGYVLTGDLALPIGLHVAWNLTQGTIYDLPVSGMDLGVSVVATERAGPAAITGGAFGPEAGITGVVAVAFAGVCTLGWARLRYGALAVRTEIATYERT